MSNSGRRLHIWLLSDGRPGHYNQSRGVVTALELLQPVNVEWLDISMRFGFFRSSLKFLLNHSRQPFSAFFLKACYRLPKFPDKQPDLIISAGGKTSFLNAALARHYGCKNIFVGSLRGLSDLNFSAVLTIEPIPGAQRNIVVELAPTTITPETVLKSGVVFRQSAELTDEPLWSMIVGGSGAGYRYERSDWEQLAEAMGALAERYQIRWLLTTSRRTGGDAEKIMKETIPEEFLADSVWYASEPRKVMQAYLGAAELVFCTEDSMSMITEAIASGKPVVSLAPKTFAPDSRYIEALNRNVTKRRILRSNAIELMDIDFDLLNKTINLAPITSSIAESLAIELTQVLNFDGDLS